MIRPQVEPVLEEEFRKGFHPRRLAGWIESLGYETEAVAADVSGHLDALAAGQRDFAYPYHDAAVYRLLERLIPERDIRRGADVGCATGCFPAMQLAAGVESCTVFEVRETETDHARVPVRVQDLTYAREIRPEFDLVTCLSTIEHVGLGRYGDRLDPWGDVKMATNLRRLLRPGGVMLMSFPVGPACVVFNQHRIYTAFRREALFGGLRVLEVASGRRLRGRARQAANNLVGRQGSFSQPIYVLEKDRAGP